jgi:hypothetical protein
MISIKEKYIILKALYTYIINNKESNNQELLDLYDKILDYRWFK